ncbi:MAG TPA: TetR family transcriptional regulator C-terminal domain-containing protein [Oculatellaceae cyanobacterium]
MSSKLVSRQDTRMALIQAGTEVMLGKGYTNTGIQEVLSALGVPKGSFYHYFESKESFAVAIVQHLDHDQTADMLRILRNTEQTPLQRLKTYCELHKQAMLSQECRKGCLLGLLSQEMADQNETLRRELSSIWDKRLDILAACIEEGQAAGEIRTDCAPRKLASVFNCGWNGAVMHSKAAKNPEALDAFIELMFDHFFIAGSSASCKQPQSI